jgi:tetratricopeptide (TPR) repeat protein
MSTNENLIGTSMESSPSSLMKLPLELRNEIYRNLLVADQGPKVLYNPTIWVRAISYPIFEVNHQIREEALRFYLKANTWISITLTSKEPVRAQKKVLRTLSLDSEARFRVRTQEMRPFRHEASLAIHIKETPGMRPASKCTELESKDVNQRSCVFPFTEPEFGMMCTQLSICANTYKSLTLAFGREYPMSAHDRKHKIMFPSSLIFGFDRLAAYDIMGSVKALKSFFKLGAGAPTQWRDVYNIISVWKLAGDEALVARDYLQALSLYDSSLQARCRLGTDYNLAIPWATEETMWDNLKFEIKISSSLTINKLVECYLSVSKHQISEISLDLLTKSIEACDSALNWPGLLEPQRATAHFNRAVAYRNRGEWSLAGEDMKDGARRYFEQAARDFFYAEQLTGPQKWMSELITEVDRRLGRTATTIEHAPLTDYPLTNSNVVLQIDSRSVDKWGPYVLGHLHLFRGRLSNY